MMIREVSKNVAPMGTIRSPVPVVCNGLRLFGIKHFSLAMGRDVLKGLSQPDWSFSMTAAGKIYLVCCY